MDLKEIRLQFPELSEKVYGNNLVYLDNAATSLRPESVVAKWNYMSTECNANIHRAVHRIADLATEEYESSRDAVKNFIGAESREEIVFTSGTTASINLAAFCIGETFISEGDEIIISEAEHHSDIVPWQMMAERRGAVIKVLPIDESGHLRIDLLPDIILDKTKIVCVTHISNVLGLVNPVRKIAEICHSRGCMLLVDGAQGIVHEKVDVKELGCDFYAFSGHKMYAATGTGVLYGRKSLLEKMVPYMGGGEMIETVKWSGTTYAKSPQKFEAGTQNISSVPTFKPAIGIFNLLSTNEITNNLRSISEYIQIGLQVIPGLKLYGISAAPDEKIPLFSFSVDGVHHEDIALILDKMGIAVRSGQMCAEPLMDRFGVTGMVRASFAPYNTMEEAEYFISSLNKAIGMLR